MEKVIFGRYPQEENGDYLDLSWRVLSRTEKGTLMITEKIIDCKPFNTDWRNCCWQTSTIRSWLKNEFVKVAFSADEKKRVKDIFLLDNEQASSYFANDEDRLATPTEYAKKQGILQYDGNKKSMWWLRSVTDNQTHVSFVNYDGFIFVFGRKANATNYGIRPAIFLGEE